MYISIYANLYVYIHTERERETERDRERERESVCVCMGMGERKRDAMILGISAGFRVVVVCCGVVCVLGLPWLLLLSDLLQENAGTWLENDACDLYVVLQHFYMYFVVPGVLDACLF